MNGRTYAYLDLAALPAIGSALLSPRPVLVFTADGTRILWANAAGAAFFGAADMAALIERRFSEALPATRQIARFARSLPFGTARLERISFARGGRLEPAAAACARVSLPDDTSAVMLTLDPGRESRAEPLAARAEALADAIAASDCLVAILDRDGAVIAASGDFDALSAAETAVNALVAAMDKSRDRLVKRAIRIGEARRPAGIARIDADGMRYHLLIVGPPEAVVLEPAVETEAPAPVAVADTVVPAVAPVPDEPPKPSLPETASATKPTTAPTPPDDTSNVPNDEPESEPAVADVVNVSPVATVAEPAGEAEPVTGDTAIAAPSEELAAPEAPAAPFEESAVPAFVAPVISGPIRFVFQMDGEMRFSFVSPEFGAAVGPEASAVVGRTWREAAEARGLDRDRAIDRLLARHDTWSGVTLGWPVDGGERRVLVDLAALPAFSRERRFEGYRGFGVIRPVEPTRPEPARVEAAPAEAAAAEELAAPPAPAAEPPARADAPANVVRLPRAAGLPPLEAERLSGSEQDAFRRIAAALAPLGHRPPADEPPEAPAPSSSGEAAEAEPLAAESVAEAEETPAEAAVEVVAGVPEPEPTPEPEPVAAVAARDEAAEIPSPQPDAELSAATRRVAELEAILDTATDGVVVVDGEGRIESLNRSAEALFGVEGAAVAGQPFADLLAEESRKAALDYLDGLARNGVASVLNDGREVIGLVPQGGMIPLFMTMGRLGETEKFCAVLRDITQWKNAEEALINARRAAESASTQKSEFLAKVSHEIRTPLNAIIGFSEVMMEERFGPIGTERYKEYLRDIHLSGAHLMSLLNDLLDLSKIEAGKVDLAFEAVALNEIVMECVALMQPQANRERIIIRTSLSGQVPSIVADPRSLRQIVLNLLSNAVKFTLAGGQVIVSTALEDRGEVTLRIRDTGIGMSEKDIETALKPFRQLTTGRERTDGTGLGLPLTKALVEANRAAFTIDSTVGQGTMVRITFPTTRVLAG